MRGIQFPSVMGYPYLVRSVGMIWGQMRRRVKMRSIYRMVKAGEMKKGV